MIARDESSLMRPRRLPSRRDAFRAFYEATGNHHEVLWRLDRVRDAASLRSRIAQGQIVGRFEYPGKEDWRYVLLDEEGLPAAEGAYKTRQNAGPEGRTDDSVSRDFPMLSRRGGALARFEAARRAGCE